MTDWKPGDCGQIVEHDDATRQPKPGGKVLPATVTGVNGPYVAVKAESDSSIGIIGPLYFYAASGWHAETEPCRWRLMPETEAAE